MDKDVLAAARSEASVTPFITLRRNENLSFEVVVGLGYHSSMKPTREALFGVARVTKGMNIKSLERAFSLDHKILPNKPSSVEVKLRPRSDRSGSCAGEIIPNHEFYSCGHGTDPNERLYSYGDRMEEGSDSNCGLFGSSKVWDTLSEFFLTKNNQIYINEITPCLICTRCRNSRKRRACLIQSYTNW